MSEQASLIVGEIVPWEIKNLCNLINAIFVETVSELVENLRVEKCCGCKVNHLSQRRHDCLMMTEHEGWEMHGLEAIERADELVWKQFIEGIRVMKLDYHTGAMDHYTSLLKNHEATLNLLLELKKSADLIEYESIVQYLSYCIKEH